MTCRDGSPLADDGEPPEYTGAWPALARLSPGQRKGLALLGWRLDPEPDNVFQQPGELVWSRVGRVGLKELR